MKVSVEARANLVRSDLKKRAEDFDARHLGSPFAQELASYGKYFVLISGPFANLSGDFKSLVDFIARERATWKVVRIQVVSSRLLQVQ